MKISKKMLIWSSPKINYTMDLNIEDSSSEELLSDNGIEKDDNSSDNYFEVEKI